MIENFVTKQTKDKKVYISVVIPAYNEVGNVEKLVCAIIEVFKDYKNFEIIVVDDGSNDGTTELLRLLAGRYSFLKVIVFCENYGQGGAMTAGFRHAKGEVIVTIDADLQNDPSEIPKLVEKLEEGYDLICGWRKSRQDRIISKKIPSFLGNLLLRSVIKSKIRDTGCQLRAYRSKLAKEIDLYGDLQRYIPAIAAFKGAKIFELPVNHNKRHSGESKYTLTRAYRLFLDLFYLDKYVLRNNSFHLVQFIDLFVFLAIIVFTMGVIINYYDYLVKPENINSLVLIIVIIAVQFHTLLIKLVTEVSILIHNAYNIPEENNIVEPINENRILK